MMPTSAATPLPRSQEVTLLVGGHPAGVRHLPLHAPISVGPEPDDTFSIPHLEDSIQVVEAADSARILRMDSVRAGGRLERPGVGNTALETLWRPDGRLPLLDTDRIEVGLGSGVAVVVVPSPLLPEAPLTGGGFRPRLIEADDVAWLASLALWSTLTAALIVLLMGQEPVEAVTLADLPDRVVEILLLPDDDVDPASAGAAGPAAPPPPSPTPRPPSAAEPEVGGGLSWGRQALEERSALLRRIAERGDVLLLPPGRLGDRSTEAVLAALETMQLYTPDQVVDETEGGLRGAQGRQGMGDARLEGGLRTGTVGQVVLVSVAASVPTEDAVAALWRDEVAALHAAVPQRGPPSEVIRGAVGVYKRQLRACFERSLKERPSLSGRITLEVDISAGTVVGVAVTEDTIKDESLSRCMQLRARSWRFPAEITEQIALPLSFSGG